MYTTLVGIDEVGRGPLAGPVGVGVALVPVDFDWGLIPGVTDSKQLSVGKREEIFAIARQLKAAGHLDFYVAMVSAAVIDRIGIVPAITRAMGRALTHLNLAPETAFIKLDGGLKAPTHFLYQKTIIKGDAKEPVIGLASIVAKVTRDRYMVRMGKKSPFAPYTFTTHKGYGTKAHRAAIAQYGLSSLHRVTYCKNIDLL